MTMEEPSVLDYVKSKLKFWQRGKIEIPSAPEPERKPKPIREPKRWPWRSLLALALALGGQRAFEPPNRWPAAGVALYFLSAALLIWAYIRSEWTLAPVPASIHRTDPLTARRIPLIFTIPLVLAAFLTFGGNLFTSLNVTLWLLAIVLFIWGLWLRDPQAESWFSRAKKFVTKSKWQVTVSHWTLLALAVSALVIFYRAYHLNEVPAEPFSDHAEKILDVYDITQGQTHIFFPRNTGREGLQMYLTVLVAAIFGTGLSFLSLKIGSALCGLAMLPYMYLLGKEFANQRVGLLAVVFAGIAYWPNVISRAGLRFPLYPLFVAPMLYYLVRGLRTSTRNDFILSGLFLGLGLHGYSPFRIVPFIVVFAIGLFLVHAQSKGNRRQVIIWLSILALTALLVFLPLMRYVLENPEGFSARAFSRLTDSEHPLPAPWWLVFLSNLWNALKMFNWSDGEIWVHSVTYRPALDVVSGALFLIGVFLLLIRYVRQRHWLDLFLFLSIPLLMLPSILSLAFPGENPALNRTSGAMVPVFMIVAMALDGLLASLKLGTSRGAGTMWAWAVTGILLLWSGLQNYNLVFNQYDRQFRSGAWNSSEMGAVIKQFGMTYGSTEAAWIVPYPYWVDTRLPAVWAGIPNRDMALWREDLPKTLGVSEPKLFIVKPEDKETVTALQHLYPQGAISRYTSGSEGHDFLIFFVPSSLNSP